MRFYYGWVVLFVAAAAMVGTLPGRTQGLGLVTEPLLADLHIGRVDYAQLNLWATLLGAAGAIGIGRLLDRFGSRAVLGCVAAALGITVVTMSRVSTFTELAIAITLTRALGQSALSVMSIAMVGHWFVRRIDMAMAVYSVALSIGFMMAFPVVGSLVQSRGWRAAWFAVGAAILAGLVPLALLVVRAAGSPESHRRRSDFPARSRNPEPEPGTGTRNLEPAGYYPARSASYTCVLGLCDRLCAVRPRRVGHRLVQRIDPGRARVRTEHLLSDAGRDRDDRSRRKFHGRLACAVGPAEPIDGDLAVRADARSPRAPADRHDGMAMVWAVMMGLGGGLVMVLFFSVWPRVYGRRQLGRIQGVAQAMTVLASAVGPLLLAACVEMTGSYAAMFYMLAAAVGSCRGRGAFDNHAAVPHNRITFYL